MDIERLREKVKRIEMLAKDALEELGDFSSVAEDVEDDYGSRSGDGSAKASKMQKILSLMAD